MDGTWLTYMIVTAKSVNTYFMWFFHFICISKILKFWVWALLLRYRMWLMTIRNSERFKSVYKDYFYIHYRWEAILADSQFLSTKMIPRCRFKSWRCVFSLTVCVSTTVDNTKRTTSRNKYINEIDAKSGNFSRCITKWACFVLIKIMQATAMAMSLSQYLGVGDGF